MTTILITGGAGFIGANLVKRLVDEGAKPHLIVKATTDLWRIKDLLPYISLHTVDLEDGNLLNAIVRDISPSVIFHVGAHGASSSHQDDLKILTSNILGTFNLLKATQHIDYEFFLHVGGSSEYGNKPKAMNEQDVLEPTTFYGVSKACSTLIAQQFAQMHQKPIGILRLFSVYGPLEPSRRFIPTAIHAALQGSILQLTRPGFSRDLIFVEDVVEACLLCWKKRAVSEIINIGTGKQTANEKVVELIEELTKRKIVISSDLYPSRPSDKPVWVADISKAKELLGWQPRYSLREGLKKTIR